MTIVIVVLALFAVSVILTLVGMAWLAYYGFKFSPVMGILVFLLPPVALWFGFYKLEKEGKEKILTIWLAGLALAGVLWGAFPGPMLDGLTGRAWSEDYLAKKTSAAPAEAGGEQDEEAEAISPDEEKADKEEADKEEAGEGDEAEEEAEGSDEEKADEEEAEGDEETSGEDEDSEPAEDSEGEGGEESGGDKEAPADDEAGGE